MPDQPHRVQIEQVDWRALLPFLRLFEGFRMAIQPAKLLPALLLVLLTYIGGLGLDLIWGPQVHLGEFGAYRMAPTTDGFEQWLATQQVRLEQRAASASWQEHRGGIFATVLQSEVEAFEQMVVSAISLDFGFSDFLRGRGLRSGGVIGALGIMLFAVPGWLYVAHPGFLAVFLLWIFLLTVLFGGAITRLAALQATRRQHASAFEGLRFAARWYGWLLLSPLIPLAVALAVGLLLALAGLALFNFPVLDIVGALLFGLMLVGGLIAALVLVGLLLGANLLLPALAVEGSDAFDAISRAVNYVIGRPWRYLFYNVVMLVYGAITYLFVGMIIFFTLWLTKAFAGLWVFRDMTANQSRIDAILPDPRLGQLMYNVDWASLDGSGLVAAAIVLVWVKLLIAILPAYALSFFFSEQTWIYLLLRRSADGSDFSEVYLDEPADDAATPPEKLEPAEAPVDSETESAV